MSRARFILYSRGYCHLCEDMQQALESARAEHDFEFEVVDVDQDPALEARFGEWVPVLTDGREILFYYHFDAERLRGALQRS